MNEPICIPNCDYVAGGPILHAEDASVKARLVPSARSVEVPQDQIHDVGLAVEQPEQTHPKQYARVAVPAARHAAQWHAHGVTPCGGACSRLLHSVAVMERASFSLGRQTPAPRSTLIPSNPLQGTPRASALRSFYLSSFSTVCVVSCSRTTYLAPTRQPSTVTLARAIAMKGFMG